MDSTDLSNELSSLTVSNDEANDENSMIIPSTKRTQFLATYQQQNFSLPKTIMSYLAKNPTSPEIYLKMIHTCKWFFIRNPILVLQKTTYNGIDWQLDEDEFGPYNDTELDTDENEFFVNQELPSVDFNNLTSKLWITKCLWVNQQEDVGSNIISSIIPKLFRFEAKELVISNQVIPLYDYIYLASTAETISLQSVTVKDENGSDVSIVKLVEIASKAKTFFCFTFLHSEHKTRTNITSKTFDELLKLPNFLQLDDFCLDHIPETFDLEAFYIYMKKNKTTSFDLNFDYSISEPYKNRLQEMFDEVIASKSGEYIKPLINFPGLSGEKHLELFYMTPQYMR